MTLLRSSLLLLACSLSVTPAATRTLGFGQDFTFPDAGSGIAPLAGGEPEHPFSSRLQVRLEWLAGEAGRMELLGRRLEELRSAGHEVIQAAASMLVAPASEILTAARKAIIVPPASTAAATEATRTSTNVSARSVVTDMGWASYR